MSKESLRLFILCLFLSLYVYLLYYAYHKRYPSEYEDFWSGLSSTSGVHLASPSTWPSSNATGAASLGDIEVFIHVSDLHISAHHQAYKQNFIHFLDHVIPLIRPLFVLATGDLTDGKDRYGILSGQNIDEWEIYFNELNVRGMARADYWFDLPGNHDRFDVNNVAESGSDAGDQMRQWIKNRDFYKIYGIQKESGYRRLVHSDKVGNISIIAIDGCPSPGPPRPYNFYGYLNEQQMNRFREHMSETLLASKSLHRIVLSHYPLATMSFHQGSQGKTFAELSAHFALYLCGHLHNLFLGIGNELYDVHPTGFAELEVGDLKISENFRIMSYHKSGTFSLSEHAIHAPAFLHIISPKDARFRLPLHENPSLSMNDIEFLLFTKIAFKKINIHVDDMLLEEASKGITYDSVAKHLPLVSVRFNMALLSYETKHHLKIEVVGEAGDVITCKDHHFTLNGASLPIRSFGKFILNIRFLFVFKFLLFLAYVFIFLFILLIPRLFDVYAMSYAGYSHLDHHKDDIRHKTIHSIHLLNQNWLFFTSWLVYLLYAPIGPLFIGELIPSSDAWYSFFINGILNVNCRIKHCGPEKSLSDSCWIPYNDAWEFSVGYMYSLVVSTLALLIHKVYQLHYFKSRAARARHAWTSSCVFSLWTVQGLLVLLPWINYGPFAFFISPGVTWFYAWNLYLYYVYLPKHIPYMGINSEKSHSSS